MILRLKYPFLKRNQIIKNSVNKKLSYIIKSLIKAKQFSINKIIKFLH